MGGRAIVIMIAIVEHNCLPLCSSLYMHIIEVVLLWTHTTASLKIHWVEHFACISLFSCGYGISLLETYLVTLPSEFGYFTIIWLLYHHLVTLPSSFHHWSHWIDHWSHWIDHWSHWIVLTLNSIRCILFFLSLH